MKRNLWGILSVIFCVIFIAGCGGGGNSGSAQDTTTPVAAPAYVTTVTPVASKDVPASLGGVIEVADTNSSINGVKLAIPGGALGRDTTISVGLVNNPPLLPIGLNYVGVPIDFGPDGTTFSTPAYVEIPFNDALLDQAGVESKEALKLFVFDKAKNEWSEAKIISIDTVRNVIIGQVDHFSTYVVAGLVGSLPDDLGKPLPGDILFKLSTYDFGWTSGWMPGHDGIYTGEKKWNGEGNASAEVKKYGKYNVVEALWDGVQYSYYKIPGAVQSSDVKALFSGYAVYMGAREPKDFSLTFEQRMRVISFVEDQIGKPYVREESYKLQLLGALVKGPDKFNCVGLVESAYEFSQANGRKGLVEDDDLKILTPAQHYGKTKPAGGVETRPVITSAKLTPSSGTPSTQLLAQISVSHLKGLGFIDSVRYKTDSGYVNPNININDKGVSGDIKAGDGIYSAIGAAGQDSSSKTMGLTFTVTDKDGKKATTRLVYAYTGGKEVAKSLDEQFLYPSETWGR